jgi:hypothetical protein
VVLVVDELSPVDSGGADVFFVTILLSRARFLRVNRGRLSGDLLSSPSLASGSSNLFCVTEEGLGRGQPVAVLGTRLFMIESVPMLGSR